MFENLQIFVFFVLKLNYVLRFRVLVRSTIFTGVGFPNIVLFLHCTNNADAAAVFWNKCNQFYEINKLTNADLHEKINQIFTKSIVDFERKNFREAQKRIASQTPG